MKFGAHVSIAGGIENAPLRAKELGCECFQMFTRSPRGGRPPELEKSLLESFFLNCSEVAISDYYVHTPYFINLASGKEDLREKSVALVREELERSSALGVKYMMTHIGSSKGLQREEAVSNVVDSILRALEGYSGTTQLLLENTAGQGDTIGASFEEISFILKRVAYDSLGGLHRYRPHVCLRIRYKNPGGRGRARRADQRRIRTPDGKTCSRERFQGRV